MLVTADPVATNFRLQQTISVNLLGPYAFQEESIPLILYPAIADYRLQPTKL